MQVLRMSKIPLTTYDAYQPTHFILRDILRSCEEFFCEQFSVYVRTDVDLLKVKTTLTRLNWIWFCI